MLLLTHQSCRFQTLYIIPNHTECLQMVPCSPEDTFNFIIDTPMGQWECTFARTVYKVDEHTDIIHLGLMPVVIMGWVLKPRDLCLLRFWYARLMCSCVVLHIMQT